MNNEERMVADLAALKNFDAAEGRINVINNKMQQITELARAYANATPEQRERVDNATLQKVIDQYNELKNERTVLYAEQEARAQQELLAQKQAAEEAAKQIINTRGTGRRYGGWNWGWNWGWGNGWLSDEQYAEWLKELEKEAYLSNPHPIFNNWDGTYYYSDGTTRYEDWNIVWWQSTNIEVRTAPSGAPYFYDKTTGNQVAPIGTDEFGNPLVVDSQWWVATMYPIDNAIQNTIIANQMASDAARAEDAAIKYANDVRDDTVVNLALAPTYLAWGVWVNWLRNAWVNGVRNIWGRQIFVSWRWMSEPMTQAFRNTATRDYANWFARTFASDSPAYLRNWVGSYVNPNNVWTFVKDVPTTNYSNIANNLTNAANKLANEHTVDYYVTHAARNAAKNYNPVLSNWNNIVNRFNANKSIFPQGWVNNNWVQYVNSLLNNIKPFSL